MKINILTLFPECYESFLSASIINKAIKKKLLEVNLVNIRDYTLDKHHRADSAPIGGGAGLILKAQPIIDSLNSIKDDSYKIILSPRGQIFNQDKAIKLSKLKEITILCGHYEGIDERVYKYFDESISIGDFILTGGETASFCLIDAISRLIKDVISEDSIKEESFNNNLLEYPQYTEPYDFNGDKVPDILYSGNHNAINKYRKKESLKLTLNNRIDLFNKINLSKEDKKLLNELNDNIQPKWEIDAIEKGKKFIKNH
ncbi:MAG: tRNA (guanosine(37)-N1)-methyltransferase TrmD [Bacillales bacterium]